MAAMGFDKWIVVMACASTMMTSSCDEANTPGLPPLEWRTCTADVECSWYDAGCCAFCAGGIAMPIRADRKARAMRTWMANCSSKFDSDCPAINCVEPGVECRSGLCELAADVYARDTGREEASAALVARAY